MHQLTSDKCKSLLVQAVCNILMKCKHDKYRIVDLSERNVDIKMNKNLPNNMEMDDDASTSETTIDTTTPSQGHEINEWTPDEFHERLTIHCFDNIDDVERYFSDQFYYLTGSYGVLLFMYTVLMTKVNINFTNISFVLFFFKIIFII